MAEAKSKNIAVEVSGLDSRFECPICLLCLKDPVLTSCGHRFCSLCIQSWLKKENACCPVDNQQLLEKDLFPDNYTRREILTQTTPCSVCNEEISLSNIDDHLASHNKDDYCYFRDVGCDIEVGPGKLKEHLENEIHYHMQLLHSKVKPIKSDAKAEEVALWEAGKESEKSNALIRVLYERVVLLEQRAHEQECQIQRQRREAQLLDGRFENVSFRHCFGEFLWKIKDFKEKIENCRVSNACYFSPGFFTSPGGYQFCARINVSEDSNHLSLVMHVMASENDIALPWPFLGTISLAIVHPSNQSLSIMDGLTAKPHLSAFARPTRPLSPRAYGFPQYVAINILLENDDYLVDGMLFIKILVQTKATTS